MSGVERKTDSSRTLFRVRKVPGTEVGSFSLYHLVRERAALIMSAARLLYDQFKSRGGWIGKSPGHNATPRMLRDRNRSREKRLYGPDGRPSARVLIFRKRSGTISESARLVCGTDGGPLP